MVSNRVRGFIKFINSVFRDIGIMDEKGTLKIVGRSKDMIVRGGENIYPTEIEQFLIKHPEIQDVYVSLK